MLLQKIRKLWDEQKPSKDQSIAKGVEELAKIHKFSKLKNLVVKERCSKHKKTTTIQTRPFISSDTGSLGHKQLQTSFTRSKNY